MYSSYSQVANSGADSAVMSLLVSARVPCGEKQNTLWVKKGHTRERQVIGEKVLIRQQSAQPPAQQQILVLGYQLLTRFTMNDKYIKCLSMVGYDVKMYTSDIELELIDINFL